MAGKNKQTRTRSVASCLLFFRLNVRQYLQPFLATSQASMLQCTLIHVAGCAYRHPCCKFGHKLREVDRTSTLSNMFLHLKMRRSITLYSLQCNHHFCAPDKLQENVVRITVTVQALLVKKRSLVPYMISHV